MRRVKAIIRISGVVQGVGFRFFTWRKALELGIDGTVENTIDGGVEVVAEGEESKLKQFIEALRVGPRWAHVTAVDVEWAPPDNQFQGFSIIH
ncbi:MAG: acylphosphatase [candidate division KSB1 bacterium]|nr:acylphosphatase [candidate division KSB1 bacterium]MDZ7346792.1 acylphosphatase [candidate division KSB1 bacterium]